MKIEDLNGVHHIATIYQNNGWCSMNVSSVKDRITGNLNTELKRGESYLFNKGIPSFLNEEAAVKQLSKMVQDYIYNNDLMGVRRHILTLFNETIDKLFKLNVKDVKVITQVTNNFLKNYSNPEFKKYLDGEMCNLIFKYNVFTEERIKFFFPSEITHLLSDELKAQAAIVEAYNTYVQNISLNGELYFSKIEFYKRCIEFAKKYNVSQEYVDNYFKSYGVFFNVYNEGISINNYRKIEESIFKFLETRESFEVEKHTDGKLSDITLTDGQVSAVNSIVSAPRGSFQICSGGPGTGKTTSISHALNIAAEKREGDGKYSVLCLAPTGAAKKVVENMFENFDSCNTLTRTIHAYIYDKQLKDMEFDYVIIDESSMADILLFNNLINKEAIVNSRIIFMGDPKQLPSIGFGAILRDAIDSKTVPHTHLTEVKRQAEGSNLLKFIQAFGDECDNSTVNERINYLTDLANASNDIEIVNKNFVDNNEELYKFLNQSNVLDDIENSQVIAPTNKTLQVVNNYIQDFRKEGKREVYKKGYKTFYTGDKVVFLKNTKTAVQNGTIGFITGGNSSCIEVRLDDGTDALVLTSQPNKAVTDEDNSESLSDNVYIEDMTLGYCVTVHKSQGGTWKNILYLQGTNGYNMVCNELLYTAFSRASENLTILCASNTMKRGLLNRVLYTRKTYLQSIIKKKTK